MTLSQLEELKERLEKATGPDRELDLDLFRAFNEALYQKIYWGVKAFTNRDLPESRKEEDIQSRMLAGNHPRYTASLDAAIALTNAVLPDDEYPNGTRRKGHTRSHEELTTGSVWFFRIGLYLPKEEIFVSEEHKSEPIALLLATISALIERENTNDR